MLYKEQVEKDLKSLKGKGKKSLKGQKKRKRKD